MCHELEKKLEMQKFTLDQHMSKLVQAAAQADEKKKHEQAEIERKKFELHGSHHGGHGETSVDISYSSFSYESSQ
jgi:hypothetical protein